MTDQKRAFGDEIGSSLVGRDADRADDPSLKRPSLEHLVYDAALDNSLWPELILELTEQMLAAQRAPGMHDAEKDALVELAAHFRRGLMISERMVALQEKQAMSSTLLDSLTVGIALVDERGTPILTNRALRASPVAAVLGEGEQTLLLTAGGGSEPKQLPAWVRECNASSRIRRLSFEGSGGGFVLVPNEEAVRMGFPAQAAAVLLTGGTWESDAVRHFALTHDLTERETALVRALADTGDLKAAAATLDIAYETARSYVKKVFEKSGCTSQVELLSALAGSPLASIRQKPRSAEEEFDVRRTFTLPDGRLMEHFALGPKDGEPVLLFDALAGVTADVLGYPALCHDVLSRHHIRLIVPCRPGSFRTQRRDMKSLRDFVPDVLKLLERTGTERFSIMSVSFGAGSALAVAHELGERIERVVMSSATYPAYRPPNWRDLDQFHQLSWVLARNWPSLFRHILPFMIRSIVQNTDSYFDRYCRNARSESDIEILRHPTIRRRIREMIEQRTALGLEGMIEENLLNARGWDFEPAGIDVPVELFHGDLDNVSPLGAAQALADDLPRAALTVMRGNGHYQHIVHWPWMMARAAGRDVAPNAELYAIPD